MNHDDTISIDNNEVEDWMVELWDWIDNHNISGGEDSQVPRDPQALRQLERLDLGYGRCESYSNVDGEIQLKKITESKAPLPGAIGNLKNLKYLRLCGFPELPPEITQLENLKELVYMNGVSEFPKMLCELKNLESLNIFKGIKTLPDELGNLTSLKRINITGSKIEKLPDSIGNLANVQILELVANRYLTTLPDSLTQLTGLESIDYTGGILTISETVRDFLKTFDIFSMDTSTKLSAKMHSAIESEF